MNINTLYNVFCSARMWLLAAVMITGTVSVLRAQGPGAEAGYQIPPALVGQNGTVYLGLMNGNIIKASIGSSGITEEQTLAPGDGLPEEVTGVRFLSMPDKRSKPDLIIGLAIYTEDQMSHYGILRSEDFGGNWTLEKPAALLDTAFVVRTNWWLESLSKITWLDADHGWLYGFRGIIQTTDGGSTWKTVYMASDYRLETPAYIPFDEIRGLAFKDPTTGIGIVGRWNNMDVNWTTDGGATWTPLKKIQDPNLRVVQADWIGGEFRFLMLRRNDLNRNTRWATMQPSGKWDIQAINNIVREQTQMSEVVWANTSQGFMILRSGEIWTTSDGGQTWGIDKGGKMVAFQEADSVSYPVPSGFSRGWGQTSILVTGTDEAHYIVHASDTNDGLTPSYLAEFLAWPLTGLTILSAPYGPGNPDGALLNTQAYPNPTQGTARIRFVLPEPAEVRVSVVDMMGRELLNKDMGWMTEGEGTIPLSLDGMPEGAYRYILEAGKMRTTNSLMIVR